MDNRKSIIDKIAQMQRLSENSGSFENEASVAARKIQELMEKYSISWAEVHQSEAIKQAAEYEQIFAEQSSDFIHGFVKKWHWDLAEIIAQITHTKYFLRGNRWMYFFGVDENAQIASALYAEWVVAIDAAAKDALKKYRAWLVKKFYTGQKNFYTQLPEEYQTKNYRESWIEGCLHAVSMKVIESQSQTKALVLYDEEVEKKYKERYKKMKKAKISNLRGISWRGLFDGREFGSKLNIGAKKLK